MSDDFTKNRFVWITQVAADRELPGSSYRVAIILLSFFNRKLGAAWPTIATVSGLLNCTDNCARGALHALRRRGHLEIEEGGGRGGSNRYRFILKDKPSNFVKGFAAANLLQEKTLNDRGGGASTGVDPIPLKESIEEEKEASSFSLKGEPHQDKSLSGSSALPRSAAKVAQSHLEGAKISDTRATPAAVLSCGLTEQQIREWCKYAEKGGLEHLSKLDDRCYRDEVADLLTNRLPPMCQLAYAREQSILCLRPGQEEEVKAALVVAHRQFNPPKNSRQDLWVSDVLACLTYADSQQPSVNPLKQAFWHLQTTDAWLPKSPAVVKAYYDARSFEAHRLKMLERLMAIQLKAESVAAAKAVSHAA